MKPYTSYNPYFLIAFIVWVIVGGWALASYDSYVLFSAFNTHYTPLADILMYYTSMMGEGVISSIILLLLLARPAYRNWWYFTAAVLSNGLTAILIQYIKHYYHHPRPLSYFNNAPWIHISDQWPHLLNNSFPSGHTCAAFCLFAFLAFLLRPAYRWIGILFFALGLLVGYSRMYLAAHFFLDVYVGSIIGTTFTVMVIAALNRWQYFFFKKTN